MSPMPSAQQGTRPPTAKDTRRPWARLMEYRLDIADWDAARMVPCDNAWIKLDGAPVLLRAQAPPEDEKEKAEAQKKKTSPPPEPMGHAEKLKARVEARGPSRLRYEVRQTEEAPETASVTYHRRRGPDALLTTVSGAASPAGRPKGGLYVARRSPTTTSSRAQPMPSYPPCMNGARNNDYAPRALDIDEEPSRMARPMGRALATRLFTRPLSVRTDNVPADAGSSAPTDPALEDGHLPLKRKRGRVDEADVAVAAPPTKRRAKKNTMHVRLAPGSQSAELGTPVGRHVQHSNISLPRPLSHARSAVPRGTKPSNAWSRWAVTAWAATLQAVAALVSATKN